MRMHQGRPVLALDGVETMTEAEALHGVELRVPRVGAAALPAGTYYEHDLVGCTAGHDRGREVGMVRAVEGGGGTMRLVGGQRARRDPGAARRTRSASRSTSPQKRIVIDPPEGLLDVNA